PVAEGGALHDVEHLAAFGAVDLAVAGPGTGADHGARHDHPQLRLVGSGGGGEQKRDREGDRERARHCLAHSANTSSAVFLSPPEMSVPPWWLVPVWVGLASRRELNGSAQLSWRVALT